MMEVKVTEADREAWDALDHIFNTGFGLEDKAMADIKLTEAEIADIKDDLIDLVDGDVATVSEADALTAITHLEQENERLRDASLALYMAGFWRCDNPDVDSAALWEALRDALGLKPGHSTNAGVNDLTTQTDKGEG